MARRPVPTRPVLGDLVAGVSVSVVLIPQAVAYATLAGLPAASGLLAAFAAPIAASFFASSPYLATGPVAITSLLVLGGLSGLALEGSAEYVALAALLALFVGLVRLVLGFYGGGVLAYLMSQPVLSAFTAAAGLLILMSQIPAAVGVPADSVRPGRAAFDALVDPSAWSLSAVAFSVVTLVAMLVVRRLPATFPIVPILVVVAVVVASATGAGGPVVGSVSVEGVPNPLTLPWSLSLELVIPALVIALVGFAEPAAISRRLAAEDRQHWNSDRELVSQGVANIASGFAGGYPVGGSFSRSTLNRLAGARTRWSGLAAGLIVLAFLPFAEMLESLPRSVLAGIIIASVLRLADPRPVLRFWKLGRVQFATAALTYFAALVLAPRLDLAVLVGVGVAALVHLWRELHIQVPADYEDGVLHVRPSGVLYFASAPGLEDAVNNLLADHPATERLRVDLDGLGRLDVTGAMALRTLLEEVREAGMTAEICNVPPQLRRIVGRVLADDLAEECRAQLAAESDGANSA
ncbi:MAG: SulP family inorganic anion transporter [Actinomycetes bacterium]